MLTANSGLDIGCLSKRHARVPSAPENVEEALGAEQKRLQLQSRVFPLGLHGESGTA